LICGNGRIDGDEKCDDGGLGGCLKDCSGEARGYNCTGGTQTSPTNCTAICGDGIVVPPELCDDENQGSCLKNCSGPSIVSKVI